MENKNESKKLAVVTGASRGIGYELAKLFAQDGYDLLIAGRDEAELEKVASELRGLNKKSVEIFCEDLARIESVYHLKEKIDSLGSPVDCIVMNAGRGVGGHFVGQTSVDEELEMIGVNIVSTMLLAKLVVPEMVQRGQGRVLFTGSVSGVTPVPFEAVYGGTKAFVNSFAHALRYELKETGVTVSLLMPDATDTEFFERAHMLDTKVGTGPKQDVGTVAKLGYEAMMNGEESVFGGDMKTRIQDQILSSLPIELRERFAGGRSRPGSAEH